MTAEDFVRGLIEEAAQGAIISTIASLQKPPGKRPSPKMKQLAETYAKLPDEMKNFLRDIVGESVDSAVFGMLCILDGVRVIEEGPGKGDFELYLVKNGQRTLLNSPTVAFHDIYRSLVPPT